MKKWKVLQKWIDDKDIVDILLENRGIASKEEKESFLTPPGLDWYIKALPVEFKKNVKLAKDLIYWAVDKNMPIIVYGDYDADGVCATAILYKTLKNILNYDKVSVFIPNRFEHGYGLSEKSITQVLNKFSQAQKVLFITVDTGITAVKEIAFLKSLGHKVVVSDHHQKAKDLPPADVIVWDDSVVGSTISWILSLALGAKSKEFMCLAGIATVTDVQPLVGFNRALVKKSLAILNTLPPLSVKKLLHFAGKADREITTYDLGWIIGPRLNAVGRLEDAGKSLDLLILDDEVAVTAVAKYLNDVNIFRQEKTLEMYGIAVGKDFEKVPKIIISRDEKYHEGIIGLVAGRIVQKYNRPCVVISLESDVAKGSVRSIPGIDIISILRHFEDLFINLGGHPMAAGFSIEKSRIDELQVCLDEYFEQNFTDEHFVYVMNVDLELPLDKVGFELLTQLDKLKPFGVGNEEPKFVSLNVGVAGLNWFGNENQHLGLRLFANEKIYRGVLFNAVEHTVVQSLQIGEKVDIVYKLRKNSFNGNHSVELNIVDLQKSV